MENQTEPTVQPQSPVKTNLTKKSFPKWILIILGLIILIGIAGGAYYIGQKSVTKTEELNQTKPTQATTTTSTLTPTPTPAGESTLKIPEYNVQITLSKDIKDAYYVTKNNYIYLKVHSLDTEPQCKSDDTSTAALGRAGKDEVNPMSEKKYSESYKGVTIGNYFYYTELAQYECATSTQGKALLEKVRTAFTNTSTTIKAL